MFPSKIVRSICYFSPTPTQKIVYRLDELAEKLASKDFEIQTKRICTPDIDKTIQMDSEFAAKGYMFGLGTLQKKVILKNLDRLLACNDTSFNLDLTQENIDLTDTKILSHIIRKNAARTFQFTYVFNNPPSSAYFPAAHYQRQGFSIGLQPTDLSLDCATLDEWLRRVKTVWEEIVDIFHTDEEFLGIDSSIAPLTTETGSFVQFVKRLGFDFSRSTTTDLYLRITRFLKEHNPRPVGLCGLMFPCLEDNELAKEYEKGNFPIERNIFLSLHSGLGVDTYPIGIDEKPERIVEILRLVQGLSNKYRKPLSCRFVSDGKANVGERTKFRNPYLADVIIQSL